MRKLILAVVISALSVWGIALAKKKDPARWAPRRIKIDVIQKKMKAVEFDHFKHASTQKGLGIPCTTCHHKSRGTDVSTACTDCHRPHRIGAMLSIKGAFHKRCMSCHLSTNKKTKRAVAPVTCQGCHNASSK